MRQMHVLHTIRVGCTYLVMLAYRSLRPHALELACWPHTHQPVPLQGLVILNMLGELRQRIPRRAALSAT